MVATIGELITAATRLSSARKESLDTYAKALRRIATGVLTVKSGKSGPKQGTDAWRRLINATPLDKLTSAAVTVNSLLRNSKALLSKRVRPFLEKEMVLPSTLWFESVPMEKEPSCATTPPSTLAPSYGPPWRNWHQSSPKSSRS